MFTLMQDPAVASRLAHLHVQERLEAAALHRLVRGARTTREQPSPEPTPMRRTRRWVPLALRLSFR
jgi:anti-sigma factor RsiW